MNHGSEARMYIQTTLKVLNRMEIYVWYLMF